MAFIFSYKVEERFPNRRHLKYIYVEGERGQAYSQKFSLRAVSLVSKNEHRTKLFIKWFSFLPLTVGS